ncbi:MAG: hypothetical protein JWQ22_1164 [Devosia sp.]|nr:hypothetical protein [Devosia sp.]
MGRWAVATALLVVLSGPAAASEAGDQLAQRLYDGTLAESYDDVTRLCNEDNNDACFAVGLTELIGGVEGLTQALYRHGATTLSTPIAAMLFGMEMMGETAVSANQNPEPLSYEQLRTILDDFVTALDTARSHFEMADVGTEYVITIDPLKVRVDLDGDGTAGHGETLGALLGATGELANFAVPEAPTGKIKRPPGVPDSSIGFDNADAIWFAGYTQVVAAPIDLLLAHDLSDFFDAYLHRVFPKAGLPMQDYSTGGTLFMDADSDGQIADLIAAIHTVDFPVIDPARLAGVLQRLKSITALSRQNWKSILAETDDRRELVPSPSQTSLVPGMAVTDKTVAAWMATLDTFDQILDGKLLVPHWRFEQGFDLKAYLETASETDLVLLITGSAALPYIKPGRIVDAQSFAEANEAFGADWLNYAFWFN